MISNLIYLVLGDFEICGITTNKQRAEDIKEVAERIYDQVDIRTYQDGVFYE